MRWLLALLVLLPACEDESDPAEAAVEEPPRAEALSEEECTRHVDALSEALPTWTPLSSRRGAGALPLAEHGGPVSPAPIVTFRGESIAIDDRRAANLADEDAAETLAAELERATESWSMAHAGEQWDGRFLLEADADVPARELWGVLSELSGELVWDVLVQDATADPPASPGEAPDWVAEAWQVAVDAPTFAARRPILERTFHRAIGDCLAARPHAYLVYSNDPESGSASVPDLPLGEALLACGCIGVDFEALTPLLQRGLTPRHRQLVALRLRVDADASEPLTLPAGANQGALVAALDGLPAERRDEPISVRFED